jgi:hypothetical protein
VLIIERTFTGLLKPTVVLFWDASPTSNAGARGEEGLDVNNELRRRQQLAA